MTALSRYLQNQNFLKVIYILLFLFFVFDLAFSFQQFKYFSIDGDFSNVIIPSKGYQGVMENPLGWQVISHPEGYPQPNRYFEFKVMAEYFRNVPLLLQYFFSPIDSIYTSIASLKLITQFGLIYLIGLFLTGNWSLFHKKNILIYTLCYPFFQTWGYQELMAIIDPSITYAFCYATSTILVLLFFLPFVLKYLHNYKFKFGFLWYSLLILYAVFVNLNASLNAPIILIISLLTFLSYGISYKKTKSKNSLANLITGTLKIIPKPIFYLFTWASITALYSIFIGTFNTENDWTILPLFDRYPKLIKGVINQFFGKIGMAIFTISILIQLTLFYKKHPQKNKYHKYIFAAGLFITLYVILLPLGGYRSYRPYILRRDTFIPILLLLLALFSFLTIKNWTFIKTKLKPVYIIWISTLLILFTNQDKKIIKQNECEIQNMLQVSQSTEPIVELENDCTLMSWWLIKNPAYSEYNMKLLYYYGIVKNKEQRYVFKTKNE